MTKVEQIYKCSICGNIVEILHSGVGRLVCCGQPMELLKEKTEDKGLEKHLPVIEKTKEGIKVKVGLTSHPMEEAHFIEWIELIIDDKIYRKFLKPRQTPEAKFKIKISDFKNVQVREYCNLHGLWKRGGE